MPFRFTDTAIDTASARRELLDRGAGGYVSFEGWVRDHNEGQEVTGLEYESFQDLAVKEGERILTEALTRFPVKHALCIHRVGSLDLTEMAVWVGVSAAHRAESFDACRFIIDEVKHRVPIWKKEHYRGGNSGWVNCERCAAAPQHSLDQGDQGHLHDHDDHHNHAHPHNHSHGQEHPQTHDHENDRDNSPLDERSALPAAE
jgi:molybdopterin synthase catalytic subunit